MVGFLDVTKFEVGGFKIDKGQVDLIKTCDLVLDELKGQILDKKIILVKKYGKNIPKSNIGDKTATVIFQNLLSNAVKYTGEAGKVVVSIKKSNKGILIIVKDNGSGIPEKAQGHIFTKLYRAENAILMEPSGTGLGLYLVKSLLSKVGGKIWFKSKENVGSTFYVKLK